MTGTLGDLTATDLGKSWKFPNEYGLPVQIKITRVDHYLSNTGKSLTAVEDDYGNTATLLSGTPLQPAGEFTRYVAGFLFCGNQVLLIRKLKPAWQAGRLNAVGGKVEADETPAYTMRREFREEAGLDLPDWELITVLRFTGGEVWFYRTLTDPITFSSTSSQEAEQLEVVHADYVQYAADVIPNLKWLVPLTRYTHDAYLPFLVEETQ